MEVQADRQELEPDRKVLDTITLADLVKRYRDEVVARKKSKDVETIILNAFLRGRPETRGEAGWPVPNVIPNGCQSQFGEPHVDTGHPAAA